jgi:hypothetical protein
MFRHGHSRKRSYGIWLNMLARCENPAHKSFRVYAGQGITVCEEWHDYEVFIRDMGEPPDGFTLDRVNNSLGYSASNCRWATPRQQAQNRRDNVLHTLNGVTLCVAEWARRAGMRPSTLQIRLRNGWPFEVAISKPLRSRNAPILHRINELDRGRA